MDEDLLNVIGRFSEVSLDCLEKQNEEIEHLEQENQQLKDRNKLLEKHYKQVEKNLGNQIDITVKYESVLDEIRGYITSYSSIHTIQFGTEEDSLNDIEANKMLDEKTITEMTHRYLKVHDKLLQILDKAKESE